MSRGRWHRSLSLVGLLLLMTVGLASPGLSQEHANIARGRGRTGADTFAEIDSVNRFNGSLSLAIPIGQTYPVDANLSYGLTLVYNSQVWEQEEVQDPWGTTLVRSKPLRTNNAGLGWMLGLGRLSYATSQGLDTARNTYLGPDGSRHTFYSKLHEEDPATPGIEYTRDGSYLRHRGAAREIEFPDGTVHAFDANGYPIQIRDPFANAITITYRDVWGTQVEDSTSAVQWWIVDRHGRTQKVVFKDLLGSRVVDRVELTAFNNTTATWTFRYNLDDSQGVLFDGCEDTDPAWIAGYVPLLTRVTLPDNTAYTMPTSEYWWNAPASGSDPCRTGLLKSVELPTLGRTAWTYVAYTFPVGSAGRPFWERKAGVGTRQLVEPGGSDAGTWTYQTGLFLGTTGVFSELRNELLDPLGHRTRRYFSVCANPASCPAVRLREYSLPITRDQASDADGRFLSAEVLANGSTLARSTYLLFEHDTPSSDPALIDQQRFNQRVLSSSTIFHDDGNRYFKTINSNFDGLGHYRSQVQTTNVAGALDGTLSRARLRSFNPTTGTYPGSFALPTGAWILGTFDIDEVTEGGQSATATYCFDSATGALVRRRVLRGFNRHETNEDTVERFTRDAHGNLTGEDFFGGRFQASIPRADPGSLTNLCTMSLPANPEFALRHTYSAGALASSGYLNVNPLLLWRTIDAMTGLPSGEYDASGGILTTLTFDIMGRLTRIQPPAGHDGRTRIDYDAASGPGWSQTARMTVREQANTGTPTLTTSVQKLDFFGRPFRVERTLPGGSTAAQVTEYGYAGEIARVSEWQVGTPGSWTYFLAYDPFGRPGRVRPPDAASPNDSSRDVVLVFSGLRQIARTVPVATAASAETEATRTEFYDGWGRLRQVTEPSGVDGADVTTTFSYDVNSRLVSASTPTSGLPQVRSWSYNAAGLLQQESHPEVGSAVVYDGHDSRGNVWRETAGSVTLESHRDSAERLVLVKQVLPTPVRLLKEFSYATANSGPNLRAGKLQWQRRYNWIDLFGTLYRSEIHEAFTYGGRGGRVSAMSLDHYLALASNPNPSDSSERFTQSWQWDELGNPVGVSYPICTREVCTAGTAQIFDDVPIGHVARAEIEGLALAGITGGCTPPPPSPPPFNYCPTAQIARQEMAVFLIRASTPNWAPTTPSCSVPSVFSDVPCDSNFRPWIEEIYARGITGGCGTNPLWFCPTSPVTNEQMAVFLLKALEAGNYQPVACTVPSFSDVPCSSVFARWIEELANRGITSGCGGGAYCPQANVTRAQMAQLMVPTFGIPVRIQPTTNRTVVTTYSQGLPAAVGTVANTMQYANQLTYHPNGMLATLRHANSPGSLASESWVTDIVGLPWSRQARPDFLRATGRWGTLWDTGGYQYDAAGHIKAIGAGAFEYDKVGRLVSGTSYLEPTAPTTPRTQQARYDQFGNIERLTTNGTALELNPSQATNRLGGATAYDNRGNLTSWNDNLYDYGPFGEVWKVTSSETWFYVYNADDERVFSYQAGTGLNRWTLRDLDGRVLREFSATHGTNWVVTSDWIWRGSSLLAAETPRGLRHFSLDHLGSPRLVTTSQGKKGAFHLYYPFGREATAFDQDDLRAKFTGHERDLGVLTSDADDLDYMHARFYNGQLARFFSVDRLQGSPYRPQSLNRYAYVLGSPINFVDPWGLEATCSGTVCGDSITVIDVIDRRNPLDDYFDGIDASNPGGGGGSWSVTRNLGRPGLRLGLAFVFTGALVRDGLSACFSSSPSTSVYEEASCWVLLGTVGGTGPKFADPRFAARLSKQYAKYGVRSVEKSLRSISKNLAEHEARLASGRLTHTSSIEREIRTFRRQIETIEQFLERIGGSL